MDADFYIKHLNLLLHPEGGYYKETYRCKESIEAAALPKRFKGTRNFSTAIYYLLKNGQRSVLHRIKSDECWHFYAGGALHIHVIDADGKYNCIRLGSNIAAGETLQHVVPATAWFAAEPAPATLFTLAGCTVAPGFDFNDFEIAIKETMLNLFPWHKDIIENLCK